MQNLKAEIKYIDLGVAIGALLDMATDYADLDECKEETIKMCARKLAKIPTIEADPVKHGRWVYDECEMEYSCSECGREAPVGMSSYILTNYCPNCGAKMDLEG